MTVVFFTPALDSVYRRKRWQEFHLFMDEYRAMISYLTLMPNSFLVEGAFRHAAMERGRKAKLPPFEIPGSWPCLSGALILP